MKKDISKKRYSKLALSELRAASGLAALLLAVLLSACGGGGDSAGGAQSSTSQGTAQGAQQQASSGEEVSAETGIPMKKVRVNGVTYAVDETWEENDAAEGAFWAEGDAVSVMLQSVSTLQGFSPDEYYEALKESYGKKFKIKESDAALSPFTTVDGVEGQIARIVMTEETGALFQIDLVIFEELDKVVVFSAETEETYLMETDLRRVTETMSLSE